MNLPPDPFNRVRLPGDFSREGRVALLAEAFRALIEGRMPSQEAAMFCGAGGMAWLQEGGRCGSLERDFWRVTQTERSTATPARVYAQLEASARRGTAADDMGTMLTSNHESDQ